MRGDRFGGSARLAGGRSARSLRLRFEIFANLSTSTWRRVEVLTETLHPFVVNFRQLFATHGSDVHLIFDFLAGELGCAEKSAG